MTARGLVRQPRDPRAALADYDSALKLNPRYLTALQNKANVLAEDLGRTEEAVAALDTLLAFYPDYVPALAGRGVLHARLGRREAAHADAREALPRDTKPFNVYQVAGIYALTSRQNPDDRREALRLLESALSQGFGLDLLDKDRDLDAIRDQPEFRRLVEAARARRTKAAPRATTPRAAVERRGRAGSGGASRCPFADERLASRSSPPMTRQLDVARNPIRPLTAHRRAKASGGSHGQVTTARSSSIWKAGSSGRPSGCPGGTPST